MRTVLKDLVDEQGSFKTDAFSNAQDALNIIEELITLKEHYDLIFCDWHMPGMSGLEFLQALKKIDGVFGIPVVMLTVEKNEENIRQAVEAGASGYILKTKSAALVGARIKYFTDKTFGSL